MYGVRGTGRRAGLLQTIRGRSRAHPSSRRTGDRATHGRWASKKIAPCSTCRLQFASERVEQQYLGTHCTSLVVLVVAALTCETMQDHDVGTTAIIDVVSTILAGLAYSLLRRPFGSYARTCLPTVWTGILHSAWACALRQTSCRLHASTSPNDSPSFPRHARALIPNVPAFLPAPPSFPLTSFAPSLLVPRVRFPLGVAFP